MKRQKRNEGMVYSTGPSPIDYSSDEADKTDDPSGPKVAVLRIEKKGRGGKTVTIVEIRNVKDEEITDLSKQLKRFCGVGGKKRDNFIELQGDQRIRIKELLAKDGYQLKG